MEKKRCRGDNWLEEEEELLKQCVERRKDVIENKGNDPKIFRERRDSWAEIERVFISSGYNREISKLKDKWRRMKGDAKKEISKYRKEIKKTGGGPQPPSPSVTSKFVESVCAADFLLDESRYDSDGIYNTIDTSKPFTTNSDPLDPDLFLVDPIDGTLRRIENKESETVEKVTSNKEKGKKRKRDTMTDYETKLLELHEKKFAIEIKQMEQIHEKSLEILDIEKKTKEMKLKEQELKNKKIQLEIDSLIKK